MKNETARDLFYRLGTFALICLCGYFFFRYAFAPLLPFFIGWWIALAVRPLSFFLARKTRLPRRALSLILALLLLLGALILLGVAAYTFVLQMKRLGEDFVGTAAVFSRLRLWRESSVGSLGDAAVREQVEGAIDGAVASVISTLTGAVGRVLSSVPALAISLWVCVVATVWFSLDLEKINAFVRSLLPDRVSRGLGEVRGKVLDVAGGYLRAYGLLMLIAFGILWIGFCVLRIEYAFVLALLIAVLDALPLFGVGTVLVPWGILSLLSGSVGQGTGLLILYAVHELIRQWAEPRLLGHSLGLHPLATLLCMIVGYALFGIGGVFLLPVFSLVFGLVFDRRRKADTP